MKIGKGFLVLFLCIGFIPLFAQVTTGTINGSVTTDDGSALPGVVLTIESTNLQGQRSAVSQATGSFLFKLLPPGVYTITATMAGMQTMKQDVRVGINSMVRPKFVMVPDVAQETIVVTAESVMELDSTTVAAVFDDDFVEKLPRPRTFDNIATLSPGVTAASTGGISVSGGTQVDNVYLVNGALANFDYVRGSGSNDIVIEDDIQETQVLTGNVSAEFGNFSGGVVNVLTKSGSNEFHGTFRTEFLEDDWTGRTPLQKDPGGGLEPTTLDDTLNQIYTLTVNGPIIKDKLWFAAAYRTREQDGTGNTVAITPMTDEEAIRLGYEPNQPGRGALSVPQVTTQDRYQLKLTGTFFENHTVVASYLDEERDLTNSANPGPALDLGGFAPLDSNPESLATLAYRGLITPELTIDINYAKRKGKIVAGSTSTDLIGGTSVRHQRQGGYWGGYAHAPFGNANDPAIRNGENWNAKMSYFLDSDRLGSHDIILGVGEQSLQKEENNSQSASNWTLFPRYSRIGANNELIPIFTPLAQSAGGFSMIMYWPVLNPSQGSDFTTQTAFINDVWTLNEKWYFNLGLRYDKNDTKAQDGQELSATDQISPRFTANFDPNGDGVHQFSLGLNRYVAALNGAAAAGEVAGNVSQFVYFYDGPLTESMEEVFAWFDENVPGGIDNVGPNNPDCYDPNLVPFLWYADFALSASREELTTIPKEGGLDSPTVDEFTLGYKYRIGNKGFIKADLVYRDYNDFLAERVDETTGQNVNGLDVGIMENADSRYDRTYTGLLLQGNYRFNDKWFVGGNYTLSRAEGNITGVTAGGGAFLVNTMTAYPEYTHPQINPEGRMAEDSTHNLRVWSTYDLATRVGQFSFTGMQTYISATPYGTNITCNIAADPTAWGFPAYENFHYNSPPQTVNYTVGSGDEFEFDDLLSTDLSILYNYTFANRFDFFFEIEVTNIFNHDAVVGGNTTVTSLGVPFNMFTETPQEGVHYSYPATFGDPTDARNNGFGHYQKPRELRVDVGFKF